MLQLVKLSKDLADLFIGAVQGMDVWHVDLSKAFWPAWNAVARVVDAIDQNLRQYNVDFLPLCHQIMILQYRKEAIQKHDHKSEWNRG